MGEIGLHVEEMVMTYERKDIVLLALVVGLKVRAWAFAVTRCY